MNEIHLQQEAELYIFDMDGTVLDAMPFWHSLRQKYLKSNRGSLGANDILQDAVSQIRDSYENTIPARPQIRQLVQDLSAQAKTLCLITSSDRDLALDAMYRVQLLDCFEQILTTEDLTLQEDCEDTFVQICGRFHVSPQDTIFFGHAPQALRSARKAGCYVVAILDDYNQKDRDEIVSLSHDSFYLCGSSISH